MPQLTMWGNLMRRNLETSRVLSTLIAFSWLSWLVLSLLLGILLFSFVNKVFMDPLHGRWNPPESHSRQSSYEEATVGAPTIRSLPGPTYLSYLKLVECLELLEVMDRRV